MDITESINNIFHKILKDVPTEYLEEMKKIIQEGTIRKTACKEDAIGVQIIEKVFELEKQCRLKTGIQIAS